jgi:TPP-dependent pyruvate/acetoin dehydrogenase alpha subunit
MKYVPREQVEAWRRRDPVDRQEARLVRAGVDIEALRAEIAAIIDAATDEALAMPMPDPVTATEGVFYEGDEDLLLSDGAAPWSGHS